MSYCILPFEAHEKRRAARLEAEGAELGNAEMELLSKLCTFLPYSHTHQHQLFLLILVKI